jgi:hypothetical protein
MGHGQQVEATIGHTGCWLLLVENQSVGEFQPDPAKSKFRV